jgi:hypothetical protein
MDSRTQGQIPEEQLLAVDHESGRCWLADMGRIINEKKKISHFEERFSYVKEIRFFDLKPPVSLKYVTGLPTLQEFLL